MVQFQVLTGKMAGATVVARHFPFAIGRSASMHLRLDDTGIWDQHLVLQMTPEGSFLLARPSPGLASVNGTAFETVTLRNGDLVELGSVRLRFALADVTWRRWQISEFLFWFVMGVILALQGALIWWLAR
jgi:hypothetical protein